MENISLDRLETADKKYKARVCGIENMLARIDSGEELNYNLERVKKTLTHNFMDLPEELREKHKLGYFKLMGDIHDYQELIQQGLITSP